MTLLKVTSVRSLGVCGSSTRIARPSIGVHQAPDQIALQKALHQAELPRPFGYDQSGLSAHLAEYRV
jgi:hypothetical protein